MKKLLRDFGVMLLGILAIILVVILARSVRASDPTIFGRYQGMCSDQECYRIDTSTGEVDRIIIPAIHEHYPYMEHVYWDEISATTCRLSGDGG